MVALMSAFPDSDRQPPSGTRCFAAFYARPAWANFVSSNLASPIVTPTVVIL
jgi:hypothetical protein